MEKTELALARAFAAAYARTNRYAAGSWYHYESSRGVWLRDTGAAALDVYSFLDAVASHKNSEFAAFVRRRCKTARGVAAILQLARPLCPVDASKFDAAGSVINTPAGVVDIITGDISPHKPEQLSTRQTACSPGGEGCNAWRAFVRDVFPALAVRDYAQRLCGLFVFGYVRNETLCIAYGTGANGKSTFFNTLVEALGTYATTASADLITTRGGARNLQPELAELQGRRLVVTSELGDGARLSSAMLKRLCSSDAITAARKFCAPVTFVPSHSLITMTNELPAVAAVDYGTWRRLAVLPFVKTFRAAQQKTDMGAYLRARCLPAALAWLLEGARLCARDGYRVETPPEVAELARKWRRDADDVRNFVDACCVRDDGATVGAQVTYNAYTLFARRGQVVPLSPKKFAERLAALGIGRKRTARGYVYLGLRVQDFGGGNGDT